MEALYLCAIGFVVLNVFITKRSYKYYLVAILSVLVFFAYNLKITENMDFYRHIETMKFYNQIGFEWVMENRMESNPLATLMYYGFSHFENPNIIPAITAFVCYGTAFWILMKCAKRYKLTKKQMNLLLLFFCLNFYYDHAITNIRIYLCYSLISLGLYNDLIEKRYRLLSWLIYITACFLHYAVIPFVLFRVAIAINSKIKLSFWIIAAIVVVCVAKNIVISRFGSLGGVFSTLEMKNERYGTYEVFGLWQFISSMLRIITMLGICSYILSTFGKSYTSEKNVSLYLVFLSVMLLSMLNEYQLIYRTPNFYHFIGMVPMSLMMKEKVAQKDRARSYITTTLLTMMWISSVFTITYQVFMTLRIVSFEF